MQKFYYELVVKPSSNIELFSDFILDLTDEAIELENDSIIVRSVNEVNELEYGIKLFATELSQAIKQNIEVETCVSKKENIDWFKEYQQSITPIEIGNFYIRTTWHEENPNFENIIINPAMAFGSGHHETTRSCIKLILNNYHNCKTMLDVGCGSGILSMVGTKLGLQADICDTDELAIANSKENFSLNNVRFNKSWIGSANSAENSYDLVVANIVADVLIIISNDLIKILNQD
ncbi:MAG: 50S ribosomal protein L11 methyltransferase, partial [Campylobacterales bacterium]|nr:50S ribosomal protein L11 methyltransferase [Campylobacterales bacterium]